MKNQEFIKLLKTEKTFTIENTWLISLHSLTVEHCYKIDKGQTFETKKQIQRFATTKYNYFVKRLKAKNINREPFIDY